MIENFHFIRPLWFLALIPVLLAFVLLLKQKSYSQGWSKFCDQELLEYLSISSGFKQKRYPLFFLTLAWLISVFALAGPSWQKIETPLFSSKDSLVIILDLSNSMNAEDLKPSRLARARHKLTDLLKMRREGQTALIVYAGDSHVVSPLTADSNTILSMVPILNSSLMPVPGTNLTQAIQHAIQLFKNAGEFRGKILLLTDGINRSDQKEISKQIKLAKESGYITSIIGIGSPEGAPVASSQQGGYLKDQQGNIYISRLQSEKLTQLAQLGGGQYQTISVSDQDIKKLLKKPQQNQFDQLQKEQQQIKHDKWQDEGIYLVLILLPFALLAFRRGWLLLLVIIITPFSEPSYALTWDDLWLRADQQGSRAFQLGQHEKAAEQFKSPEWQGSAYYRAGQYDKALQAFSKSESLEARYNKGNTLAQMNRFEEAIKAYQEVLEEEPQHQDSLKNKTVLEKFLEQQQQQQQQQQNKNSDQQNQQSDQNQQQSQQQKNQQPDQKNQENEQQQEQEQQQQSSQQQQQNAEQQSQSQQQKKQQNQQQDEKESKQQAISETENDTTEKEEQEQAEKAIDTQFSKLSEEQQQSMQQYLQQIPDDPSYLLRRKFYLNSRRNPQQQQDTNPW